VRDRPAEGRGRRADGIGVDALILTRDLRERVDRLLSMQT
jgi:hypothetical protein